MSFHTSNDQSFSRLVSLKHVEKSWVIANGLNKSVVDTTLLEGPGLPLLEHLHTWSFSNDSVSVDLMMLDEI